MFESTVKRASASYVFPCDLYATFLENTKSWVLPLAKAKPFFREIFDTLTFFLLNPGQISYEIVSSFVATTLLPLLQQTKTYCDADYHVEQEMVYHVGRKTTGQLRFTIQFPFGPNVPRIANVEETERFIETFRMTTPVHIFKTDFTPCCTKYRYQLTYRLVPKYDGVNHEVNHEVYHEVYQGANALAQGSQRVCECGVAQDQHKLQCSKLWWRCQKCSKCKEAGHQFCTVCGERNADHAKESDCLCLTTLNSLNSDELKKLYKAHVDTTVDIVEMSQRQYQVAKLRQALLTRTMIVVETRPAMSASSKRHIPHALRTQVWSFYIGLEKGTVPCFCCEDNKITPFNFECGHVVAESKGGPTDVANLRPICSTCNKSMQTKNLFEFKLMLRRPKSF